MGQLNSHADPKKTKIQMQKILTILGARPQFIKSAPVSHVLACQGIEENIVHTGQHYDIMMSDTFFHELNICNPIKNLGIGSMSTNSQIAACLQQLDNLIDQENPSAIMVYGDTTSTLAGALAAKNKNVPLIHIEAGLRSFNRKMPEEHNRVLTDHCSTLLFCPTETAVKNLYKENIQDGVFLTGDTMCDAIRINAPKAEKRNKLGDRFKDTQNQFIFLTLHRPYNIDDKTKLKSIFESIEKIQLEVVLPVHPRLRERLKAGDILVPDNVTKLEPVGYFDSLFLQQKSCLILTDSGGLQKEAYMQRKPCITLSRC